MLYGGGCAINCSNVLQRPEQSTQWPRYEEEKSLDVKRKTSKMVIYVECQKWMIKWNGNGNEKGKKREEVNEKKNTTKWDIFEIYKNLFFRRKRRRKIAKNDYGAR